MSHSEIADALTIPKSSLTLLIKNMVNRGYLDINPDRKRYHLGAKFAELAKRVSSAGDLVSLAHPLLADISDVTGESSALSILEGDDSKVIATVESRHRLMSQLRLGDLAPLYATSGGKAILSSFDERQLNDYFRRVSLISVTAKTVTSEAELRRQIIDVQSGALAEVFEEYTPGIVGLAIPITSDCGNISAAINVAMPTVRYSPQARQKAEQALRKAGTLLVQKLSG